jgi:predicted nucleotidyltransferase
MARATLEIDVFGFRCRCVTLEKLIHLKRSAGRTKDLDVIAELETIAEERQEPGLGCDGADALERHQAGVLW